MSQTYNLTGSQEPSFINNPNNNTPSVGPAPIVRKANSVAVNDNLESDTLVTERRDTNSFNDPSN
jgi:hypothetical protein